MSAFIREAEKDVRPRHTRRRPREDRGRDRRLQPQAEEHLGQWKLEEEGRVLSPSLWREHGPADTFISDFLGFILDFRLQTSAGLRLSARE